MDKFLGSFKKSYFIVFISVFLSYILFALHQKIQYGYVDNKLFVKIAILLILSNSLIVYIHNINNSNLIDIIPGNPPF